MEMTREEALNKAINIVMYFEAHFAKSKEAREDAANIIDVLEREPCEDAISRQAVNTLIDELARSISDERCCISRGRSTATIMRDIRHLPPVTPQPKTGHWIDCKCDKCGYVVQPWNTTNYCPNCGAKMLEVGMVR